MKKWLTFIMVAFIAVITVGCGGDNVKFPKSTYSVDEGKTITLKAEEAPKGKKLIYSSSDDSIVKVDANGVVTGIAPGTATITVTIEGNKKVEVQLKVTVTKKTDSTDPTDNPFFEIPRPDLGGMTIKIMAAEQALYEHNPFHVDYKALDKEAKQDAWDIIRDLYNVNIEIVAYPESAPWGPQRVEYLHDIAKGTATAHIHTIASEWIPELAQAKSIENLTDAYSKYGMGAMNAGVKQTNSFKNQLYGISGGVPGVESGFFYNMELLEKMDLESPAKMFLEGRWTYTNFAEYMLDVQARIGEHVSEEHKEEAYAYGGEVIYLWQHMVNSAGVKIMDVDSGQVNINSDVAYNAATALVPLKDVFDPKGGYDASGAAYKEGRAFMSPGGLWFVKADNRWNEMFEMGFVPAPMPDNGDVDDVRTSYPGSQTYVIPTNLNLPEGVTAEDLFRVIHDIYIATEIFLEADDNYDADIFARAGYEQIVADPFSVEALMFLRDGRIFFDPFEKTAPHYNSGMGAAIRKVVRDGGDYQVDVATLQSKIEEEMAKAWG